MATMAKAETAYVPVRPTIRGERMAVGYVRTTAKNCRDALGEDFCPWDARSGWKDAVRRHGYRIIKVRIEPVED